MSNFLNFITMTDGYKLDHRRQYPSGTQFVFSNLTARSTRIPGVTEIPAVGRRIFTKYFLEDMARDTFFNVPKKKVLDYYRRRIDGYFGPNSIGVEHIAALHDLQYIPLCIYALPEGTLCPLRVPMLTVENTHPDFFWLTNYIETPLSSTIWQCSTNAQLARMFRKNFDKWAAKTSDNPGFVDYQGHDFSFRGMSSPESAARAGIGHCLFFKGTDSLPVLDCIEYNYCPDEEISKFVNPFGVSVPATEHAVMCAGGKEDELATIDRLLDLYPTGILSVVSDTWDLWHVIGHILPLLQGKIMGRNGKLVIRPDSGDPVKIICGDPTHAGTTLRDNLIRWGVIQSLWYLFGGVKNSKGYIELDPHIGAIYGDSINLERQDQINSKLAEKGFASTNWVGGIGSYTYQYNTRDTFGMAMKATWAQISNQEHFLFKDPATDDGTKKSAEGRLIVVKDRNKQLVLEDELTLDEWMDERPVDQLKLAWCEGVEMEYPSFKDMIVRANK